METKAWVVRLVYYFMRGKITFYMCHNFNRFQVICSFCLLLKHMHRLLPSRTGPSQNLQISKGWILAYFPFEYLKLFLSKVQVSFKQMCRHSE